MTDTNATITNDITAKELALLAGVNAKAFRRFIRATDSGCGKGNRYGFSPSEAKALLAGFKAAQANRASTAQPTRTAEELEALLADDDEVTTEG